MFLDECKHTVGLAATMIHIQFSKWLLHLMHGTTGRHSAFRALGSLHLQTTIYRAIMQANTYESTCVYNSNPSVILSIPSMIAHPYNCSKNFSSRRGSNQNVLLNIYVLYITIWQNIVHASFSLRLGNIFFGHYRLSHKKYAVYFRMFDKRNVNNTELHVLITDFSISTRTSCIYEPINILSIFKFKQWRSAVCFGYTCFNQSEYYTWVVQQLCSAKMLQTCMTER
jgi:hypothetical protein